MKDANDLAEALSVITRHLLLASEPPREAGATPEPWLSIERAAAYADVSQDTVRNWIAAGRLKIGREGRVIRVRASEIDAMLTGEAVAAGDRPSGPSPVYAASQRSAHILKGLVE